MYASCSLVFLESFWFLLKALLLDIGQYFIRVSLCAIESVRAPETLTKQKILFGLLSSPISLTWLTGWTLFFVFVLFLARLSAVECVGIHIRCVLRLSERKRAWATEVGSHRASGVFPSHVFQWNGSDARSDSALTHHRLTHASVESRCTEE